MNENITIEIEELLTDFIQDSDNQYRIERTMAVYRAAEKLRKAFDHTQIKNPFIHFPLSYATERNDEWLNFSWDNQAIVDSISDHEGTLELTWDSTPSMLDILAYEMAWEQVGMESRYSVNHEICTKKIGEYFQPPIKLVERWATGINYNRFEIVVNQNGEASIEKLKPSPTLIFADKIKLPDKGPYAWRAKMYDQPKAWGEPIISQSVMTEPERLFFQTQHVPYGHELLPQFMVASSRDHVRFADFVLFRIEDCAPVIVFEIDGNTHAPNMINDAMRDKEISEILGCQVKHIDAAEVYKNAKRLGIKMSKLK